MQRAESVRHRLGTRRMQRDLAPWQLQLHLRGRVPIDPDQHRTHLRLRHGRHLRALRQDLGRLGCGGRARYQSHRGVASGGVETYRWALRYQTVETNGSVTVKTIPCGGTAPDACDMAYSYTHAQYQPNHVWGKAKINAGTTSVNTSLVGVIPGGTMSSRRSHSSSVSRSSIPSVRGRLAAHASASTREQLFLRQHRLHGDQQGDVGRCRRRQ
jgi:hypothetical protein